MGANSPAKSWFLVYNNPREIITYKTDSEKNYVLDKNNDKIIEKTEPSEYADMTPQEICKAVLKKWVGDSETKTGACAYCISANGLHHLHIVVEDAKNFRFSSVKKLFPRAHIEPTRGNKTQAENYINKVGAYAEKNEQIVCIEYHGEIKGNQGSRNDLEIISKMLDEGATPKQILKSDIRFYKQETIIRKAFFEKRIAETPIERTVTVYYHVGLAGSGKSYTLVDLVEKYGRDEIFIVSDYANGFLDGYQGQKVLFLDEFKGQIPYSLLLTMLQGYLQQFHARYTNVWGLWEEVHITSVFAPEELYRKMVYECVETDSINQLLRRLDFVVYHWKDSNGFHSNAVFANKYSNLKKLVVDSLGSSLLSVEDFKPVTEEQAEQLKMMFGDT
ncbi:MAG: hypothetical protein IJA29_00285 [Lachnospiraceae bacterium]|nr:hypothetical protein [Lachnospiraceae bacterium]